MLSLCISCHPPSGMDAWQAPRGDGAGRSAGGNNPATLLSFLPDRPCGGQGRAGTGTKWEDRLLYSEYVHHL